MARAEGISVQAFFETFELPSDPIIVLNRFISGRAFTSSVHYLLSSQTPFVFDIDDCYWDLPTFSTDRARIDEDLAAHTDARAQAAAIITTSTPPLEAELTRRFPGKHIALVPNCLTPAAPMRGGICVANTDSFKAEGELLPTLRSALRDAAVRGIPVTFLGENDNFFSHREDFVFSEVPRQSYDSYLLHVRSIQPAVGLIPVSTSRYSDCKSEIKALEFLQLGAHVYASDIPPYRSLKERYPSDRLELVANTPDAWRAACARAVAATEIPPHISRHNAEGIALQTGYRTAQLDAWRVVGDHMLPLLSREENRTRVHGFGKRLKLLHRIQRSIGTLRSLLGGRPS